MIVFQSLFEIRLLCSLEPLSILFFLKILEANRGIYFGTVNYGKVREEDKPSVGGDPKQAYSQD